MSDILHIENLSVAYDGRPALTGVGLAVRPGQVVGLVGESGSGKSTLLDAVWRVLPAEGQVVDGCIECAGQRISDPLFDPSHGYWGGVVGAVFQTPDMMFSPVRTVGSQFVETLGLWRGLTRDDALEYSQDALARLGFDDPHRILESYAFELSGGMAQRAAIALAFTVRPQLLLADEPTSALDVLAQTAVARQFVEENRQCGTALLIVSHSMAFIRQVASYVYVMAEGRIVEQGAVDQVLSHPRQEATQRLLRAMPHLAFDCPSSAREAHV